MPASFLAQRRRALQAADELLTDLAVDQSQPIDVFNAIDQLGLWLVFQPLRTLLGAVVPKGSGGIMLTDQRRPPVQRYTAAHEIGHWTLDIGELSFDTEIEVFQPTADRERLAQLFASYFLMPPPLVNEVAGRYGITGHADISGGQGYLAARDMGVSYEAAIRQFNNLNILDAPTRDRLLAITPIAIKAELCQGHRPTGGADVWPVDLATPEHPIHVNAGDEIFIALPENRTTGYRWLTDREVEERGQRRQTLPPDQFAAAPALDSAADDAPRSQPRPQRTASRIRASLALLPGNDGHRRTRPSDGHVIGDNQPADSSPRSQYDLAATETEAPRLTPVEDLYRPGWSSIPPSGARNVRRYLAGQRGLNLPADFVGLIEPPAPATEIAIVLDPDDDATNGGRRARDAIPVGGTGVRLVALRTDGEGERTWTLHYTSQFDPTAESFQNYTIDVVIDPKPDLQRRRELLSIDLDASDPDGEVP